ncbi:MAG TPA: hypothetical protein VL990_02910 [Acidobacteriaceae bacterium]|nr:hypothetical protein [Acidobacteriaceae bacterium]
MAAPPGSASAGPEPQSPQPDPERLRRRQTIGILLIVAAILVFTLLRANWHDLFPQGWWRW